MPSLSLEYTPQNAEKTLYARLMFGYERQVAFLVENIDFSHLFTGFHLQFKAKNLISPVFTELVKIAWIRTRFMAPWIATSASRAPGSSSKEDLWVNTYERGSNISVARDWAEKTVTWSDNICTMSEWEEILKNASWKASDGRYSMELHLARAPSGGFFLMISSGHWTTDGRGIFGLVDLLFKNLRMEMGGIAEPVATLAWGNEVERLVPATVKILQIESSAKSRDVSSPDPETGTIPALSLTPFTYPISPRSQWEGLPSLMSTIQLTKQETASLKAAYKRHGVKMTSTLVSIFILADIEATLWAAPDRKTLETILDSFQKSEIYPVNINFVDRRSFLSPEIASKAASPSSFGNLLSGYYPTAHNMSFIRQCITVCENGSTKISLNENNFWKGMVADAQQQTDSNKKTTLEKYIEFEKAIDGILTTLDASTFLVMPGIFVTSVGRLSSLGLLNDFTPSTASTDPTYPFYLQKLAMSFRANGPHVASKNIMIYEYDDKLAIRLLGSPRWHGPGSWLVFEESIRRSLSQLCLS